MYIIFYCLRSILNNFMIFYSTPKEMLVIKEKRKRLSKLGDWGGCETTCHPLSE